MSDLLTCPFDPQHQITQEKFIWHVTKCKKTHSIQNDLQCPYNSSHFVPHDQYQSHVLYLCAQKPTEEQVKQIMEYNSTRYARAEEKQKNPNYRKKGKRNDVRAKETRPKINNNEREPAVQKTEPIVIQTIERKGNEGFTLKKLKIQNPEENKEDKEEKKKEEKKKEEEIAEKRKEECKSQIF